MCNFQRTGQGSSGPAPGFALEDCAVPPAAGKWKGWDHLGFILSPPPEFHTPHLSISRQILGRHVIKGENDNSIWVVSEAKEPDLWA